MIVENAMLHGFPIKFDFWVFLHGNFAVAAVLISFGGLIGKISPIQIFALIMMEIVFYSINKVYLLVEWLAIADCGGTITVHVFGAYFGLAACAALGPAMDEKLNKSSYISDIFSLVGTVFLWVFWPSFVAGALPPDSDAHVIALQNTILAMLASTVVTFGLMPLIQSNGLTPVAVQNATLAGGVAIGATADIAMGPFGAIVIGCVAGALSCYGFCRPLISSAYDTCGINNLHGMPGILGGLISVALPAIASDSEKQLGLLASAVTPWKQAVGLIGTLLIAGISGAFTGLILKLLGSPADYNDATHWDTAEDIPIAKAGYLETTKEDDAHPSSKLQV